MPPKPLKFATRYKRGDEDEGDNDQILLAQAEAGDPALCMVFNLPNDEVPENDSERLKMDREKIINRIRMLGFNIEQMVNQAQDKIFLKITLPKELLNRQAVDRKIKVKLDKGVPGAPVVFDPELEIKKVIREPEDGRKIFSSLQQLEMADFLLRSEPFSDGTEDVERLVPEKLENEPVPGIDEEETYTRIRGYYYRHEPILGFRGKLIAQWPLDYFSPQPLHLVKSYFGEKITLFYAWLGYYISMLWLPACLGFVLAVSQESESPYNLIFCMALVAWGTVFSCLWKRLEMRLQYEYDTLHFEESESYRLEFTTNENTLTTHQNEITGQLDQYWMDEGRYFPPSGRRGKIAASYAVVACFSLTVVLVDTFVYGMVARPMMKPDDIVAGSILCGILFASVSLLLEFAFDSVFKSLIEDENWPTDTKHEDALIIRACPFRIVCAYYGPLFVAVAANYVTAFGVDFSCPDRQCLPVVRVLVAVQFTMLILIDETRKHVIPAVKKLYSNYMNSEALKKKVKSAKVFKYPMEEELDLQDFEGVTESYSLFVYQFGWVALFASIFPLMPALALVANLVELRSTAFALLTQTKRPRYQCATDIGSWQGVVDTLATLAILTNSLLVGLTSHTLFFYFPTLTEVDRLWCVAVLEHALFLLKLLVEHFLPSDTAEDRENYERQECMVRSSVEGWLSS